MLLVPVVAAPVLWRVARHELVDEVLEVRRLAQHDVNDAVAHLQLRPIEVAQGLQKERNCKLE